MFARSYQWMGCPTPHPCLCGGEGREQKSTVSRPCEQPEAKPFLAKVTTVYPVVYKKVPEMGKGSQEFSHEKLCQSGTAADCQSVSVGSFRASSWMMSPAVTCSFTWRGHCPAQVTASVGFLPPVLRSQSDDVLLFILFLWVAINSLQTVIQNRKYDHHRSSSGL